MKEIKIIAPVKKPEDIPEFCKNTRCRRFYVYYDKFMNGNFEYVEEFVNISKQCGAKFFINFKHDITEEEATLILKDAAQILNVPVICWQKDSSDILLAADMTFKLSAVNGYKEPIDIEAVNPSGNTVLQIQANISSLKYTEHLKDCQKLWFYEEKIK